MATVFTKIIEGELPGTFVWDDGVCVGFLSINPMAPGHTLVVPRQEVDHWVDADASLIAHLFEVTRIIGVAQKEAFDCARVGMIIAGYEVPHFHIHVLPTTNMAQLDFSNAASGVSRDDLEAWATKIRSALRSAGHAHVR